MQETGNYTPEKKTTAQVAQMLGIARSTVNGIVRRFPGLRPLQQIPPGDLLWSPEEIERLIAHRAVNKSGKRRKRSA